MYFFCKLTLSVILLCAIVDCTTIAQEIGTDDARVLLSGNISLSNVGFEEDEERLMLIQLSPSVSYFLIPSLAVGGSFLFLRTSQGDDARTAWGIGPRIYYFFGKSRTRPSSKGETYPFLTTHSFYTRENVKSAVDFTGLGVTPSTIELSESGATLGIGGGITRMLSNTVGFLMEVNYQIHRFDSANGNGVNLLVGIVAFQ